MLHLDPVVDILDNSKLSLYKKCPRRFFFTHILGWKPKHPNINLVFGRAWHEALEILPLNWDVEEAMQAFLKEYRSVYDPTVDDHNAPKNPNRARQALTSYVDLYQSWYSNHEVLYSEIGVPVPLGGERTYHTKLDKVLRRKGDSKIIVLDHKTGSRETSYWHDQWQGRNQFIGYLHAIHCAYPFHQVDGLIVDGTIVYKSSPARHLRSVVKKNIHQMSAWLTNIQHWYDRVTNDLSKLIKTKEETKVMEAFPQNDEGCISFGSLCPFFHRCWATPNPLTHWRTPDDCPNDFKVEHWDPTTDPVSCRLDPETGEVTPVTKTQKSPKESTSKSAPMGGIIGAIMGKED